MTNLYLAASTQAGPDSTMALMGTLIPLLMMFVIFYFMLIRPQKKRDKEVQKMRENLEVGDEVVSAGGIIGLIVSIKEDNVVIETAGDRSKIRLARWAIQQNITAAERQAELQASAKDEKKTKKES